MFQIIKTKFIQQIDTVNDASEDYYIANINGFYVILIYVTAHLLCNKSKVWMEGKNKKMTEKAVPRPALSAGDAGP